MLTKIGVGQIVVDHIGTLRNFRTNRVSIGDAVLFFVFPLVAAVLLVYYKDTLDSTVVVILVTALTIFAALLFNVLLLLFDLVGKAAAKGSKDAMFLKEVYNNVAFCILLSIVTAVLLIASLLDLKPHWLEQVLSIIVAYLCGMFILTLLMVLKRVHALLTRELKVGNP